MAQKPPKAPEWIARTTLMYKCSICRDLTWAAFPRKKVEEENSKEMSIDGRAVLENSTNCQTCLLIWKALVWLFPNDLNSSDPEKVLDKSKKWWTYLRLRQGCPLNILSYPYFFVREAGKITAQSVSRRIECEIFFQFAHDRPLPDIGSSRLVPPTLLPVKRQKLILSWRRECLSNHEKCRPRNSTPYSPPRLLYIGTTPDDPVKLVEPQDVFEVYATLSHCWGDKGHFVTTKSTLEKRLQGIDWEELPISFRDAVTVAREQNFSHLWIDSLCIVQDDPGDWDLHANDMSKIYGSSGFNIVFTRASDSISSSLGERCGHIVGKHPVKAAELKFHHDRRESVMYARVPLYCSHGTFQSDPTFDTLCPEITESARTLAAPLLERGWVFQERLLAPRMVHFHAQELVWECRTATWCECEHLDHLPEMSKIKHIPWLDKGSKMNRTDIQDLWERRVMREYVKLGLSKASDRLPALAGIAQHFHSTSGLQYCAGFLFHDPEELILSLLWRVTKQSLDAISSWRLPADAVPSWSWASMLMHRNDILKTKPTTHAEPRVHPECKIVDIYRTDEESKRDNFSANRWRLVLRGPLVLGKFIAAPWMSSKNRDRDEGALMLPANIPDVFHLALSKPPFHFIPEVVTRAQCYFDCDAWYRELGEDVSGSAYFLLLAEERSSSTKEGISTGLLLRRSPLDHSAMERIGYFECPRGYKLFDGAQVQEVDII